MLTILHSFDELPRDETYVLGLGFFDGCHLGHQAVFAEVKRLAGETGALAGVLTFYPHPMTVLAPDIHVPLLQSLPERLASFGAVGLDMALVITPDRDFLSLTAEEFLEKLSALHGLAGLVCGPNFTFGRGALGNADWLAHHFQDSGVAVRILPLAEANGETPSSTAIRVAVQRGDVAGAARLLGRPYRLSGSVERGFRRGHDVLGFPTANLSAAENRVVPADGVYAVFAEAGGQRYPAITNIGTNPTFGNTKRTIETFIFDFDDNLYGKPFALSFVERLRGEITFPSPDALVAQIRRDIERAREILVNHNLRCI